jgi:hypothetical protein
VYRSSTVCRSFGTTLDYSIGDSNTIVKGTIVGSR